MPKKTREKLQWVLSSAWRSRSQFAVSVHIHSVLTFPKHPAECASNMAIKRNNAARTDAQTIPSGRGFAKIMVQSNIALRLTVERRLDQKVQTSLQILLGGIYN
jgi:hypothetical protein